MRQFRSAEFDHTVFSRVQPGSFKVEHDDCIVNALPAGIFNDGFIIRQVSFNARNQLDIILFGCVIGFRIGLHNPVIGDRHRRMAPFGSTRHQVGDRIDGVHIAHVGMQMQFHTLFFGIVHTLRKLKRHDIIRHQYSFLQEVIELHISAHQNTRTGFELLYDLFSTLFFFRGDWRLIFRQSTSALTGTIIQEHFAFDRTRIIRNGKGHKQRRTAGYFTRFNAQYLSANDNTPAFLIQSVNRYGRRIDHTAPDCRRRLLLRLHELTHVKESLFFKNTRFKFLLNPALVFSRDIHCNCRMKTIYVLNSLTQAVHDLTLSKEILSEYVRHFQAQFIPVHTQIQPIPPALRLRIFPGQVIKYRRSVSHRVFPERIRQRRRSDTQRNAHILEYTLE